MRHRPCQTGSSGTQILFPKLGLKFESSLNCGGMEIKRKMRWERWIDAHSEEIEKLTS